MMTAVKMEYPQSVTNPYSSPFSKSNSSRDRRRRRRCRSLLLSPFPFRSSYLPIHAFRTPTPALSSSISSFSKSSRGAFGRKLDPWGAFLHKAKWPDRRRIRASHEQETESDSTTATDESDSGSQNAPTPPPPPPAPSRSPRREKKWWKGSRWQWQPLIQAQEIGVLLLQLGIVMFAMRLLRPGIPLPGSEPRPPTTYVSVPFSDFLSKINNDEVQKVEVDGVHIVFRLRSEAAAAAAAASAESEVGGGGSRAQEAEALIRGVTPTKRVVYRTTRPGDIKTPYEKMLENHVEFGSPDKRSGGFFNSALVS